MDYKPAPDIDLDNIPQHIAIIMDGNGRWAKARHMPRLYGHGSGYKAIRPVIEACCELNVKVVSLYAFSSENWKRSGHEVAGLMALLRTALKQQYKYMKEYGIRFTASGRTDEISEPYKSILKDAIEYTADCSKLTLNLCFNYGGRNEIADAAKRIAAECLKGNMKPEDIDEALVNGYMYHPEFPDPELLIRTGGEMRLSNFLIWEAAYSELVCTSLLWPDFTPEALEDCIRQYQKRTRKFGDAK